MKRLMKSMAIVVLLGSILNPMLWGKCAGRFVNPASDICWSCLFPITICGMKVSPGGEDISNPKKIICQCPAPPPLFVRYGLPISFWEPVRLIDVTRTKFCLVNMGGISMGGDSVRGHGNVASGNASNRTKHSFYQVHYYVYPVLYWLELLMDFVCMERSQFDVAYITEFDPLWNDDETAFVLNPELFKRYDIHKVPTFVLVKNGEEVSRLSGNVTLEFVSEKFAENEK